MIDFMLEDPALDEDDLVECSDCGHLDSEEAIGDPCPDSDCEGVMRTPEMCLCGRLTIHCNCDED